MKKADAYQMYLSGLISEGTYLSEMRVTDESLNRMIVEYTMLSDELERIRGELKERESKFKELEGHIRPVLEALEETEDKTLQVDNIVLAIKRKGYEQQRVGYKELYEYLLQRVNGSMRRLVEEAKETNTKTITVSSSIGIHKMEQGMVSMAYSVLSRMWNRLLGLIGIENQRIGRALEDFRRSESSLSGNV